MGAPAVVASSPLAGDDPGGWVEVDPFSTQHRRYANVFAAGDGSSLPTSRTAGAARGAAFVLAANLLAYLAGQPLNSRYDGYTVCPLITGYGSVLLAEFDYSLQPVSTFLVDPTRERWSFWLLKTKLLPWIYWNRVLKGAAHEGRYLQPLAPLVQALGLAYRPAADLEQWQAQAPGGCS
jgi:sulfide:quinone oxidoreductase